MSNFLDVCKKFLTKFNFLKNKKQDIKSFFLGLFNKQKSLKNGHANLDQKLFNELNKNHRFWPKLSQFKYLGQFLNGQEKKKVKVISLILGLTILALGFSLYFSHTLIVPANGGSYTGGLVGLPKFINPLYSSLNEVDGDLSRLIYSGLIKFDNKQILVPDLAENWEISSDSKTYTFNLKKNIKFHNSEEFQADDVLFTFNAIKDVNFKSPLWRNFKDVTIEKVDDYQVKFILKEAYAPFLENLTVGILPQNVWAEISPSNMALAEYNLKPIGTGPFCFKSLTKDKLGNLKTYILERNDNYYDKTSYLDELTFKFYADYESAVDALANHNIDGLNYLPKYLQEKLTTRKDLNYHELILPQYSALFFNTANNSSLKDLKVRQALAYALDRAEIIKQAYGGAAVEVNGPIAKGIIGYNPNIKKHDYNLSEAEKLLDSVGFVKKEGEAIRKKGQTELKIVLTSFNKGNDLLSAQIISKMWQTLGVKVELNLLDPNTIINEIIKNRSFEVLLFGEILGIDPDPYLFWHSSQAGANGNNIANFINKDADKLLEEARKTIDPNVRHEKYVQFQNILVDNLPAIFLYTPKYIYPVSNKILGIDTQNIVVSSDRFTNITNWYIKTKRAFK
ncbi:MAG TPA: ABC transporter substrate-binding protein [bacterium]|nr:ABC transporter substrate-binding protein [bacterium]